MTCASVPPAISEAMAGPKFHAFSVFAACADGAYGRAFCEPNGTAMAESDNILISPRDLAVRHLFAIEPPELLFHYTTIAGAYLEPSTLAT